MERRDEHYLSVNFMHKSGESKFFWPTSADVQTVEEESILCKVEPPYPVSQRHFGMTEETTSRIKGLFKQV